MFLLCFLAAFDYFRGPAALQTDHECSKDDPQGQCSSHAVLADVLLSSRYSCCRWKINRNNKHPLVSNGNHNVMFCVLLITWCICDATAKRKMRCCSAVFHGHNYRHFVYGDSDLVRVIPARLACLASKPRVRKCRYRELLSVYF